MWVKGEEGRRRKVSPGNAESTLPESRAAGVKEGVEGSGNVQVWGEIRRHYFRCSFLIALIWALHY